MNERIERIRSLLYEKSRIDVDPGDPMFVLVEILLENNLELEKERNQELNERIAEILSAVNTTVNLQTEAARETIKLMIKQVVVDLKEESQNNEKERIVNNRENHVNPYFIWLLCGISTSSLMINLILLLS